MNCFKELRCNAFCVNAGLALTGIDGYHRIGLYALPSLPVVTISIGQTFALKNAARAHQALEARQTTGSTILIP